MSEPFAGAGLDRAGDARRRDPSWLAAQRTDPGARAVLAGDAGVAVAGGRLRLVALAEAPGAPLLLGRDADGPLFAADVDARPAGAGEPPPLIGGAPGGSGYASLREAVAMLPPREGGLVAYAAALLNWHRRHPFCAACGAPSDVAEGGLVRTCPRCATPHHPRTDPVVIMLVTDGDRLVLGRQAHWPRRRYSALAGFVEPGESLEEAVAREVREESGVEIGPPRYVASQPWPFPTSLMLGFEAPWAGGEPRPQDDELEDARWCSRAEVAAAAAHDVDDWEGAADAPGDGLLLPSRLSIARRLVDRWLAA